MRVVLAGFLGLLCSAQALARPDFATCLAGLRSEALAQGIPGALFDQTLRAVEPDEKIIEAMEAQPEFKTPIWDYLATLVDDEKIAQGRALLTKHAALLGQIEAAYGVDRHSVVAVWGVESDYGQVMARWPLPQALATAACWGTRRQAFFRGELIAALKIVARGDLAAEKLRGSWAGAFGHTQFIPSTYLRLAVDFDGDGRRDLVDSLPDALASTANYLKKAGWMNGESWGYEVRVPQGYSGPEGRKAKHSLDFWAQRGLTRADGRALAALPAAGLLRPAGPEGPAFLVTKNFDAAYAYNAAESYALAISLLSDRLKGRAGLLAPWPTEDRGLSRAERKRLQEKLIRAGYDVGKPDGAIGALTRAAIRQVEASLGLPQTGRAGGKVFDALK